VVCVEMGALPPIYIGLEVGLGSISDGNLVLHCFCMLSRHRHPKVGLRGAGGGAPAPRVQPHPDWLHSPRLRMVDCWLGLGCSSGGFAAR
jgi:hypothetical protein